MAGIQTDCLLKRTTVFKNLLCVQLHKFSCNWHAIPSRTHVTEMPSFFFFASEISSFTDRQVQIDRCDRYWPLIHSRAGVRTLLVTGTVALESAGDRPDSNWTSPLHRPRSAEDIKCHRRGMFKDYNLWFLIISAWYLLTSAIKMRYFYRSTRNSCSLPPTPSAFLC
jgi:hypothetical protein